MDSSVGYLGCVGFGFKVWFWGRWCFLETAKYAEEKGFGQNTGKEKSGRMRKWVVAWAVGLVLAGCQPAENAPSAPVADAFTPVAELAGETPVVAEEVSKKNGYIPQVGDVLFQSLPASPLVNAIEDATASPYSHCGILTRHEGRWVVLEALGTVKRTPLERWILQGRGAGVEVYRFDDALAAQIPAIVAEAEKFFGRPYDMRYRMDDESIYCSELIYKAVKNATGVPVGKLDRLGDLDWRGHEALIRAIEGGALPLEREMISPRALTESPRLRKVFGEIPPRGK